MRRSECAAAGLSGTTRFRIAVNCPNGYFLRLHLMYGRVDFKKRTLRNLSESAHDAEMTSQPTRQNATSPEERKDRIRDRRRWSHVPEILAPVFVRCKPSESKKMVHLIPRHQDGPEWAVRFLCRRHPPVFPESTLP